MQTAVLLLLTVFVSGSHQQCFSKNDQASIREDVNPCRWLKSRQHFSMSLLKTLNRKLSHKNIVFSPWSIQEAFLLAYFGARHETEASLAKVLEIPANQTKPLTWRFFSSERRALNDEESSANRYTMRIANKIFLSNKLRPRRCMAEKLLNELELIDYRGKSARNYINSWVEIMTEGQIKNLIEDLPASSTATLVNAVYFKSKWLYKFNRNLTRILSFHINPQFSRPTKMMVKKALFQHGKSKELGARMLLLPYEGNRTSLIILLPDKDLDEVIEKLNDKTFGIITTLNEYKSDVLELILPKYEHKSKLLLESSLSSLGIGKAFTRSADFSGFTGKKDVFFNEVVHEAQIEMDEEGTTAAAATVMQYYHSELNPFDFRCDRPFAYIIYDFVSSKVLFMGTFRDPK